jgi:chitodextrinase
MSGGRKTWSRQRGLTVRGRLSPRGRLVAATAVTLLAAALATPADAALGGADAKLTRAPYLSDLTTSSAQVTWMTTNQTKGVVKYGPAGGSCTTSSVTSATLGNPLTIGTTKEYFNSVKVAGLTPGAGYCFRVYTGDVAATDLLGSLPSGTFTTLDDAGTSAPLTFAVLADWGDSTHGLAGGGTVNDGSLNVNQANVMTQLAGSGARFAVSVGDVAYPGGTQTTYGDVNQIGVNVSSVFGPSYWTVPGGKLPLYSVSGNHGKNNTYLVNWPTAATAAATTPSPGVFAMTTYPSFNGTTAGAYPTSYYAFTTAGTRFYMLDAAWSNSNVGLNTGGACGSHCPIYEVDAAAHWTTSSAQYQWLAADLAAHPGDRKMAFFHFPMRSDDNNQPGDIFLQNTATNADSLEKLLKDGGVPLVFNGHSHTYQRFVPPVGGVASYVTGGGGALATSVGDKGCATTDAYAVGWSYGSNAARTCGLAKNAPPASDAKIYHYLKVTVTGSRATVTPIDSTGAAFDAQTYELGPDTVSPSAPGSPAATAPTATSVALTWTAASDAGGVVAYDVYRDNSLLATVPGTPGSPTAYTDAATVGGTQYTYRVDARDLAGNVGSASLVVGGPDTTPPTAPSSLTATATSPTSVALSWAAATDAVGVTGYSVLRGGAVVGSVNGTTTTFNDPGVAAATTYSYTVTATDAAANVSAPSPAAVVTTGPASPPPTVVFADDFESGGLGGWTSNAGVTAVSAGAHAGTWAARETSTGTATSAYKTLAATSNELWLQSWVYLTSQSTSVNLVGFSKATGASIVNVYLDGTGRVSLRNNQGLVTTYGTSKVLPGAWHKVMLHAIVNGTASSLDASLDGVPVPGLTLTGQNLGTTPIGRIQLGDTSTARTYDVLLDDVVASSTAF